MNARFPSRHILGCVVCQPRRRLRRCLNKGRTLCLLAPCESTARRILVWTLFWTLCLTRHQTARDFMRYS
jgi:hypothetical protein